MKRSNAANKLNALKLSKEKPDYPIWLVKSYEMCLSQLRNVDSRQPLSGLKNRKKLDQNNDKKALSCTCPFLN